MTNLEKEFNRYFYRLLKDREYAGRYTKYIFKEDDFIKISKELCQIVEKENQDDSKS